MLVKPAAWSRVNRFSLCSIPKLHSEMEKTYNLSSLVAQIVALQEQQRESTESATYIEWTPETLADHDKRSQLINELLTQLEHSSLH
jgi:hypothetical protein